jgi:hypothetical protein
MDKLQRQMMSSPRAEVNRPLQIFFFFFFNFSSGPARDADSRQTAKHAKVVPKLLGKLFPIDRRSAPR